MRLRRHRNSVPGGRRFSRERSFPGSENRGHGGIIQKKTRLVEEAGGRVFQSFNTADDALQLASAPTQHDTGECEQATEECQGLWLGDGLHGGEASGAIGID